MGKKLKISPVECIKFIVIVIILVGGLFLSLNKVVGQRIVTGTVTEKTVKRGEDSDKYLVYTKTKDGQVAVYEITDSILKFRFNSSDLYGSIKVGTTYNFTICGYRYPILSMYPNIYKAVETE